MQSRALMFHCDEVPCLPTQGLLSRTVPSLAYMVLTLLLTFVYVTTEIECIVDPQFPVLPNPAPCIPAQTLGLLPRLEA